MPEDTTDIQPTEGPTCQSADDDGLILTRAVNNQRISRMIATDDILEGAKHWKSSMAAIAEGAQVLSTVTQLAQQSISQQLLDTVESIRTNSEWYVRKVGLSTTTAFFENLQASLDALRAPMMLDFAKLRASFGDIKDAARLSATFYPDRNAVLAKYARIFTPSQSVNHLGRRPVIIDATTQLPVEELTVEPEHVESSHSSDLLREIRSSVCEYVDELHLRQRMVARLVEHQYAAMIQPTSVIFTCDGVTVVRIVLRSSARACMEFGRVGVFTTDDVFQAAIGLFDLLRTKLGNAIERAEPPADDAPATGVQSSAPTENATAQTARAMTEAPVSAPAAETQPAEDEIAMAQARARAILQDQRHNRKVSDSDYRAWERVIDQYFDDSTSSDALARMLSVAVSTFRRHARSLGLPERKPGTKRL